MEAGGYRMLTICLNWSSEVTAVTVMTTRGKVDGNKKVAGPQIVTRDRMQ